MTHPNEEIVRQGYKAFGEGDMETLRSLFSPDVILVATGNNPLTGEYKGVDAALGLYGKIFELSEGTFTATLQSTEAKGEDTVVATHRDKAQRAGRTLDQDETLTFTIAGGKITRLEEKHSDLPAYDAFWS